MANAILAAAAALMMIASAALADCQPVLRARLESHPGRGGNPVIVASVNGHPLRFLVDTGGAVSMIKKSRAAELGLTEIPLNGMTFHNRTTGLQMDHYVEVADFKFGALQSPAADLLVMPDQLTGPDIDGTLAPDFLAQFDVEFDLGHDRINLFGPNTCDSPVYWSKTFAVVPVTTDEANHLYATVQLDGKALRGEIDTGWSLTLMSMVVTQSVFGLSETDPAMTRNYNKAGEFKGYSYPFKTMMLGSFRLDNPPVKLSLYPYKGEGPQILIGMTTLAKLRFYVSYRERKIYVTPAE